MSSLHPHALLFALSLAVACKSSSSTAQPSAESSPAAANPHAGLDPATAARAESARAAGAAPHAAGADTLPAARMIEPHSVTQLADGRSGLGPFSLTVPADWKAKPTASGMRAAEFELPASGGQAEVIVYYFGESGAGSVQANIDRWVGQFTQPDGSPSKDAAQVEKATFAGQEASIITVSGHYAARAMPGGGEAVDKPDQMLMAAIVPSPKGPYYFRLIGDRAAVAAQSGKFRGLLDSLKLQ
jgi:hypothetical protein